MNNEVTGTRTVNLPENSSNNSGYQRITDFSFDDLYDDELKEGTTYSGNIKECSVMQRDTNEKAIILKISRDDNGEDYESWNSLKYKGSPLLKLVEEVRRTSGRSVAPHDLIGMQVEFTVKYNKGYCNLNTIKRVANEDITPF